MIILGRFLECVASELSCVWFLISSLNPHFHKTVQEWGCVIESAFIR